MKTLRRGVIALCLAGPVALTGCGGYAGDEPPAPFPGAGATSSAPVDPADPDAPNAALESIAATASLTPTPGAEPTAPVTTPDPNGQGNQPGGAGSSASPGQTCAPAPSRNAISVAVPSEVRSRVSTLRVQLLQGSVSRQVVFPVDKPKKPADFGVSWGADRYVVALTGKVPMNAAWVPRARATVIIEGRGLSDDVDYRRTQTFSFRLGGPDASTCGRTPTFTHGTALRERDRIEIG